MSSADLILQSNPTPSITRIYTLPQGSTQNAVFVFDIFAGGVATPSSVTWVDLTLAIGGNADMSGLHFELHPFTGGQVVTASQYITSQTAPIGGLVTINLSPPVVNAGTVYTYVLAISVAPTFDLANNQLQVTINSLTALDNGITPASFMITGNQLFTAPQISGISNAFAFTTPQLISANGTIWNIVTMDFRPLVENATAPYLKLTVQSNLPAAPLGSLVIWDSSNITLRTTVNITTNAIMTFALPSLWALNTTSSYVLGWAQPTSINANTSLNIQIQSIIGNGNAYGLPMRLYYNLPSIDVFSAGAVVNLTITASLSVSCDLTLYNPNIWLPQGSQKNGLYKITVSQAGNSTFNEIRWDELSFQIGGSFNPGSLVFRLFKTDVNNSMLDPNEVFFPQPTPSGGRITFSQLHQFFLSGATGALPLDYIFAVDVSPTANTGLSQLLLTLDSMAATNDYTNGIKGSLSPATVNFSGSNFTRYFSVTGVQSSIDYQAPLKTFNNGTSIRILTINIAPQLEKIRVLSLQLGLAQSESPVIGTWSMSIGANQVNLAHAPGNMILSLPSANLYMFSGITQTVFVDFTPDLSIPAGLSLNININSMGGIGDSSGLTLNSIIIPPSLNVLFCGLRLTPAAISVNTTVIGSMEVPLYGWSARSCFTNTTLNRIRIDNSGSLLFTSLTNRIQAIRLYQDTNTNNIWDNQDLFVSGSINGGHTYASPDMSALYLGLNEPIAQYAGFGPDKQFFLTYETGGAVGSSLSATARLSDADYLDSLLNITHNLQGQLAGNAISGSFTTGIADFQWVTTNQVITQSVMGASGLVVLKFTLKPLSAISSLNIEVGNNLSLFTGNDLGLKRISLIEDKNSNGLWDITDLLQDEQSSFNLVTSVNLRINNITPAGQNHDYLLAVDVGQTILASTVLNDVLNLSLSKAAATTSTNIINIAGLLPQPRTNTQIHILTTNLVVSLLSVTPNQVINTQDPRIWLTYQIDNPFPTSVSITDLSPQFYQTQIQSRNVTNEFRFSTINLPATLGPGLSMTLGIVASPQISIEQGSLVIDAAVSYLWNGQNILLTRRHQQTWSRMVSGNLSVSILIPTYNIFYQEVPNYIQALERESMGATYNFRNGEIIEAGDALKILLADSGVGIDYGKTSLVWNNLTLNASSVPAYTQDRASGTLRVGPLSGPTGNVTIRPFDIAGNSLPRADISYKTNTTLFVQDFLPYPSRANAATLPIDPLRIGFLLSRPADVTVYILNGLGQIIWKNQATYPSYGYQLMTFNGTMTDGTLIPRGLYLIKLVAKEIGSGNQTRALTKFVVD